MTIQAAARDSVRLRGGRVRNASVPPAYPAVSEVPLSLSRGEVERVHAAVHRGDEQVAAAGGTLAPRRAHLHGSIARLLPHPVASFCFFCCFPPVMDTGTAWLAVTTSWF
jgi:hypothetical protein